MSRHNRERDNFSWTRPAPKPTIPKGLRGRNIGLYFKNQQNKKKQRPREYTVVKLTIPPAVITVIENDIKSIKDLAKESNILIPKFTGLNLVKREIKPEEEGYDFSSDIEFTTSSEKISSSFNEHVNSPSTSNCSKNYESIDVKIKTENIETAAAESIENFKTVPLDDTRINVKTSNERIFSLRGAGDFKYGYEDIITGTFDEKLNECLAKGLAITKKCLEVDNFCVKLQEDYKKMLNTSEYKKFKQFRETLPTYKKSTELLEVINNNQVIVISGETGCGKSTQVPQLILDEAINNNKGGYVNILVTQPRRIAASSLAMRVAKERAEPMGVSVGYAVRLERVDARARGSIMFITTGILLAALEVEQGLTNYTHVILDEVHERTCDIDLAMSMLKKVLPKRKELKVILMSATIDADTLSLYFDNSPMFHIEGLAYPVRDVYLEEILEMTKYKLPFVDNNKSRNNKNKRKKVASEMEKGIQYCAEIAPWLESVKNQISRDVYLTLQDHRIEDLNMDLMLELVLYICSGPPGAILIFLPGIADISKLLMTMQNSKSFPSSHFYIYPLHSKLPSLEQHKIFEKPPPHVRKIIVATNIAETSITVDDIVYVIDSGKMKYSGLNIENNVSTLATEWVAQANLRQRRGRAGRCQAGICFHLLSSGRAYLLTERILPEIQRDSLLEPVLTIKRLRLGKAAEALQMLPSPPADKTIKDAVKHLQQCGALDYMEKLNPLGWHLARLPVHPAAGKLLLLGALFGCLNRAASVAAVWGFKDPFQLVIGKEDEVDAARKNLSLGGGSDHIAISEAIIRWENKSTNYEKRNYAYSNFLSNNTLGLLSDMKRQLGDNLKQMGFLPSGDIRSPWENRNKDNLTLFKAIVAAALFPNVAAAKWEHLKSRNPYRKPPRVKGRTENGLVHIHPSSVLACKPPRRGAQTVPICQNPGANWLVYWRQQRSTELYLLEVTLVQTLPLLFFGELTVTEGVEPDECYISITSVKVCSKIRTAELLIQLRGLLDQVLASKIGISSTHATVHNPFEEKVLDAVIQLITAEEEQAEYPNDFEDPSESDNSEVDPTGPDDD